MSAPVLVYSSGGIDVWHGDAREVAATLEPGAFSLAVLDGPYGIGIAEWDRVADLPTWYAPHLDNVDRLCAPSATLYLWNTAEGWATLHPGIVARGWTFRSLITWDKGIGAVAGRVDTDSLRTWPTVTEVCGMYQREAWAPATCAGQEIAYAAGRDDRNTARDFMLSEWAAAGLRGRPGAARPDGRAWRSHADRALGTHGIGGHYFNLAQWSLPTWEAYQQLAAYAAEHGPPRDRPYLVHPKVWPGGDLRASYEHLRASYEHLRASYEHLRAEYEASRPAFGCPLGVSNVWRHPLVSGRERLTGPGGSTLHPCQKPLAFAERIIRASSRPGESVWVPFAGTAREAVAAQRLTRRDPAQARRVVSVELDAAGRYLPAVAALLGGPDERTAPVTGQAVLL